MPKFGSCDYPLYRWDEAGERHKAWLMAGKKKFCIIDLSHIRQFSDADLWSLNQLGGLGFQVLYRPLILVKNDEQKIMLSSLANHKEFEIVVGKGEARVRCREVADAEDARRPRNRSNAVWIFCADALGVMMLAALYFIN